jgi:hypothetical protein
MFALSTLHWVLSVALTFVLLDGWNSSLNACYGSDHASVCINRMMVASDRWLPILNDTLLINVSTVQSTGLVPLHHPQASPVN